MNLSPVIGRLLGYENVSEIDSMNPSFGSAWAEAFPALIVFGCLIAAVLSAVFYWKGQPAGGRGIRILLATFRTFSLSLFLLILADPILELKFVSHPRPLLWVLIDGSDSMAIEDEYTQEERDQFADVIGTSSSSGTRPVTRMDYLKALMNQPENEAVFAELAEKFRLRFYQFEGTDSVKVLEVTEDESGSKDLQEIDWEYLTDQLTTTGEVTAIGNAYEDLARRHATSNLAGVLTISDFAYNAGNAPDAAAKRLSVPIYTLGLGAITAKDLAVTLQAPLKMKKGEQSTLSVMVAHQEFDDQEITLRVSAKNIANETAGYEMIKDGEQTITLDAKTKTATFPFTPEEAGRFSFEVRVGQKTGVTDDQGLAEITTLEGEIVDQNNRSEREVSIIDDYMRLLFVEYEPTWEWRFVKEVFHRDKLVGMRGFRTYLRSADKSVEESNELFLQTLTQSRNEFFKYDVIFLGDVPASMLSNRFCEMTKEFVSQFGGGLVVMAGPRFGPGELAKKSLSDMLPVIVDPDGQLRDEQEFSLQLTPLAENYDFMQLGQSDQENEKAWSNMNRMPWYQPVKRLEPSASTILAAHPTAKCADNKTPQPLIAIRKYGRGEVIYVGTNEMWRLRRKYGETYYRKFWGQMIHRLGLSHALGSQKRFVVRTDRQKYRADEKVILTVEAYNEEFQPLTSEDLPDRTLKAELIRPSRDGATGTETETITISELRPGVFETRVPVFEGGEYVVRVDDPIAKESSDAVHFQVSRETVERRDAVRNVSVQNNISFATQGKSYELDTFSEFLDDFNPPELTETNIEILTLWDTWLTFALVIGLLLGEWFLRKMVNLT